MSILQCPIVAFCSSGTGLFTVPTPCGDIYKRLMHSISTTTPPPPHPSHCHCPAVLACVVLQLSIDRSPSCRLELRKKPIDAMILTDSVIKKMKKKNPTETGSCHQDATYSKCSKHFPSQNQKSCEYLFFLFLLLPLLYFKSLFYYSNARGS